jgi:predicted nucleic acid-binding protein
LRLVDASVFVHAYLKPKRRLTEGEVAIKRDARGIVGRLSRGEEAQMTVVHVAEVANILEENLPLGEALQIMGALLSRENIKITEVSREDCLAAQREAKEAQVGLSDSIAFVAMKRSGLEEIYSFDRDFDKLEGVKRVRS